MFASYQGRRRECPNCGRFNFLHDCDYCTNHMCENCELSVADDKHRVCSHACFEAICTHAEVSCEVYEESNGAYLSSVEVFTCRDCGARVDEDRQVMEAA